MAPGVAEEGGRLPLANEPAAWCWWGRPTVWLPWLLKGVKRLLVPVVYIPLVGGKPECNVRAHPVIFQSLTSSTWAPNLGSSRHRTCTCHRLVMLVACTHACACTHAHTHTHTNILILYALCTPSFLHVVSKFTVCSATMRKIYRQYTGLGCSAQRTLRPHGASKVQDSGFRPVAWSSKLGHPQKLLPARNGCLLCTSVAALQHTKPKAPTTSAFPYAL